MAQQNQLLKRYQNFFGFDLKSSDLTHPEQFASEVSNCDLNAMGSLIKRKGISPHASSAGPLGTFVYNRIDENGGEAPELLSVGSTLKKWAQTQLTITYSGAEVSSFVSIVYDTASSQYRCILQAGSTIALDQPIGLGVDEITPFTCNQLKTAIDVLSDWACSITGITTVPAAYLDTLSSESVGTGLTAHAGYWSAVNSVAVSPFSAGYAKINDVDYEPASAVQLQNILYIATGFDEVQKYDGNNLYRAGVPSPSSITSAITAHGSGYTGQNYVHKSSYVQVDDNGNFTEGNLKTVATALTIAAPSYIDVTVSNIVAGSGFNTNCAIVAGLQTTVTTITVDNGSGGAHTLKIGDTAYFYDSVSAAYVERKVTNVAVGTITISGAAVTVADNAVISANLRIAIYRNETSATYPTLWYEVEQIPNNSFAATQVYQDQKADAALGVELIVPLVDRSPPPKARYLTAFQNLLIAGCLNDSPNVIAWSDIDSPEYFPTPDNQQIVQSLDGDRISAVAPSNDVLIVFQKSAIHAMSGDLVEANYRIDQITNDVGCIAHQSVRDIRGAICFLSEIGPRMMSGASVPTALGTFGDNRLVSRIDPMFIQEEDTLDVDIWQLRRAWAYHDRKSQKYLLFIPKETVNVTHGVRYCNSGSTILVYDYARDAWFKWDGINGGAGIVVFDKKLFYIERGIDQLDVARNITWRRQTTGTQYDYNDHNNPISFVYKSPWDFLGEASVVKNYLTCRIFTTETVPNTFTLSCETNLNFATDVPVSYFSVSVGSAGYGSAQYGASYGDPQETSVKHKLSNGRAKALKIIFRNSEPQTDIVITGYELQVVTPYKPAMKV